MKQSCLGKNALFGLLGAIAVLTVVPVATIMPAYAVDDIEGADAPDLTAVASADRFAFRRVLTNDSRVLAIYPEAGLNNTSVKVVATRPDRTRVDLIAFHPRPDWLRRYWFREPIPLPKGTTIEVTVLFDDETPLLPLSLSPASATRPDLSSMRLTLNVVP